MIIPESFYIREDVVRIAKDLLGKVLVSEIGGVRTAGMIVETEAYAGVTDRASHAYGGRRTPRTEVMYRAGGVAYVYLCYGIHHLVNVVTNTKDVPHAVLIRGLEPLEGVNDMLRRRNRQAAGPRLTAGPGALSQAMGIRTEHTGCSLQGPEIFIEDRQIEIHLEQIIEATRVGVAYAGADALRPYRFYFRGNPFVSKGNGI
jgi:DNA-3-methyladenine glycosylase